MRFPPLLPLRGQIQCSVKGADVVNFARFEPRTLGLQILCDAKVRERRGRKKLVLYKSLPTLWYTPMRIEEEFRKGLL
jgi:hypothetical protein